MLGWIRNILGKRDIKPSKPDNRWFPWIRKVSGEVVTIDTAFTLSAVYRAVSFISQTVGIVPWGVYENYKIKSSDPVHYILNRRPNPEMSPFDFKRAMTMSGLNHGNGYAEIEFNNAGIPMHLWPMPADNVRPVRHAGELQYLVSVDGIQVLLPAWKVFHIKNLAPDGIVGLSVIGLAARTLGSGLAAENYSASLYANQAIPSGVLEHPKQLSAEAATRLREQFADRFGGSKNAGKPIVLEEDMKFKPLSLRPEDLQFLESRKFTIEEIARWYGLPPHKLADLTRGTFSNIEHLSIEVVNDAIMPWLKQFEEEANFKLLGRRKVDVYTKMNVRGLLRGDNRSRMEYYKGGVTSGIFTINETREWEDLPPVEGGDKPRVQMQMVPVDAVDQNVNFDGEADGSENIE